MDACHRADLMAAFRSGSSQVLIATNLLARGFGDEGAPLVLNYDLPTHCADYIHRIGRFRSEGVTINLVTAADMSRLREIEGQYIFMVLVFSVEIKPSLSELHNMGVDEIPSNIADLFPLYASQ
jgi:superfamily II DNA/RNA helicase